MINYIKCLGLSVLVAGVCAAASAGITLVAMSRRRRRRLAA